MPSKMQTQNRPRLVSCINLWTFLQHPYTASPRIGWSKLSALLEQHDITAVSWLASRTNGFKEWIGQHGYQYGGLFDYGKGDCAESKLSEILDIGNGPINCQLGDHDTSTEEALELTLEVMTAAEKLGANVHIEAHRDTATETPEKMDALIDAYRNARAKDLKVNYDYSHPASLKHLLAKDYSRRLITRPNYLQASDLIHLRPFNGHHCQIAVTDGQGAFTPECLDYFSFVSDVFDCWLAGPHTAGRTLWVVPELGPLDNLAYCLSCFPSVESDVFVLNKAIHSIWDKCIKRAANLTN